MKQYLTLETRTATIVSVVQHCFNSRSRLLPKETQLMATNPPKGDGHRNGAVRDRSQTHNPRNDRWVKRDSDNGRFMDQKADDKPFKGVRKER
jgi:hypothetical protein